MIFFQIFLDFFVIFRDETKYINTNEAKRLIINITLVIKKMISNTKDIWRLESKWSDHDRFWTDHDRKLAEVSSDFFLNFSCAHKHSRQSSYKKLRRKTRKTKGIYRKTRKPLRRRELSNHNLESEECVASLALSIYSRYAKIFLFIH